MLEILQFCMIHKYKIYFILKIIQKSCLFEILTRVYFQFLVLRSACIESSQWFVNACCCPLCWTCLLYSVEPRTWSLCWRTSWTVQTYWTCCPACCRRSSLSACCWSGVGLPPQSLSASGTLPQRPATERGFTL